MEYLNLGKSHLTVSRVALGSLAFGGHYGVVDRADSIRTIKCALDSGITLFDTASWYGGGHVEEILAEAIGTNRDRVTIADKVCVGLDGADHVSQDALSSAILRQVEGSLRRLRTDRIDLCQIYLPDPSTPLRGTMEAMEELRLAGKVRSIGFYDADAGMLRSALRLGQIDALQTSYNILNRSPESEILPLCRAARVGFLACEPLCRGLLAGKLQRTSAFDMDDLRSDDRRFKGSRFLRNIEDVNRLQALAHQEGLTLIQLTLGWVLQNPSASVAVCGAKSPDQLRAILAAESITLTPEQVISVDQIVGDHMYQHVE